MSLAIETHQLSKHYGDVRAVDGVELLVETGSIHGLLGANGAGKSTLIGILGTLVRPTGGSASLLGHDVARDQILVRERIGFAMQEAGVDTLATATEYLVLQARLYGIGGRVARERAAKLLRAFDLEAVKDRRIGGFSGGMRRRVDLAAALIHRPPVLFLDEPSEGLDPVSRHELWTYLKRLNQETGMTILLSTHYMDEADHLCDKITFLQKGKIVAEGSPRELKGLIARQSVQLDYTVSGSQRADVAEQTVSGSPERIDVLRVGDVVHVDVDDASLAVPVILSRLKDAGATPDAVKIREPSLDDVYLDQNGVHGSGSS